MSLLDRSNIKAANVDSNIGLKELINQVSNIETEKIKVNIEKRKALDVEYKNALKEAKTEREKARLSVIRHMGGAPTSEYMVNKTTDLIMGAIDYTL